MSVLFKLCSTQEKVEKGDNSKSIDVRVMYLRHDALPYHTRPWMKLHYNSISRTGYHPDKKMSKGNNSKSVDARVTELVHDTSSYQGLSIYEVSFQ